MDNALRDRLAFNQRYSDAWWADDSALARFFSFSEKFHAYTALQLAPQSSGRFAPTVLDIGFGAGYLLRKFRSPNTGKTHKIGLDISLKNIRQFKRRCPDASVLGIPMSPFATRLPLAQGSIDIAFCCHVIEHVPDDLELVAEISRILKDSGQVIFLVPINEEHLDVPTHVRKYNAEKLQQVLNRHFSIIRIGSNDCFSGWIRYLGVNKSPINNILKKGLIAVLSLFPLSVTAIIDSLLIKCGGTPSQAFVLAEKRVGYLTFPVDACPAEVPGMHAEP